MLKKIESIRHIKSLGLNTHNTVITNNLQEAIDTLWEFQRFTIRTDIDDPQQHGWGDGTQLPFMMQPTPITLEETEQYIIKLDDLIRKGFWLIIADGIKHDAIQDYNANLILARNGDFSIEMSTEKVPLRKMFDYPVFSVKGNITDSARDLQCFGDVKYDKNQILNDVADIYQYGIFNKTLELTKYPILVGEKPAYFVFWEVQ